MTQKKVQISGVHLNMAQSNPNSRHKSTVAKMPLGLLLLLRERVFFLLQMEGSF